jgi:hypothetical protein
MNTEAICRGSYALGTACGQCSRCLAEMKRMKAHPVEVPTPDFLKPEREPEPIPMLLFCPNCSLQHIDAPQPEKGWDNPPHRSHECQRCGWVWRPADVPTTGVATIKTKGQRDRPAGPIFRCSANNDLIEQHGRDSNEIGRLIVENARLSAEFAKLRESYNDCCGTRSSELKKSGTEL